MHTLLRLAPVVLVALVATSACGPSASAVDAGLGAGNGSSGGSYTNTGSSSSGGGYDTSSSGASSSGITSSSGDDGSTGTDATSGDDGGPASDDGGSDSASGDDGSTGTDSSASNDDAGSQTGEDAGTDASTPPPPPPPPDDASAASDGLVCAGLGCFDVFDCAIYHAAQFGPCHFTQCVNLTCQ